MSNRVAWTYLEKETPELRQQRQGEIGVHMDRDQLILKYLPLLLPYMCETVEVQ